MPWRDPVANRKHSRERARKYRIEQKILVLSHYGANGILQCCWPGCDVIDVDLLTLDHVDDCGALHRKETERGGGHDTYVLLKQEGFPPGYQTLCWNHQWKKRILWQRDHWLE